MKYGYIAIKRLFLEPRVGEIIIAMVKTGAALNKRFKCTDCGSEKASISEVINIVVVNMKPVLRLSEIEMSNKKAFKR